MKYEKHSIGLCNKFTLTYICFVYDKSKSHKSFERDFGQLSSRRSGMKNEQDGKRFQHIMFEALGRDDTKSTNESFDDTASQFQSC